jgi:hypothetical protein
MLRYHNKPPRRPRPKARAKAAPSEKPRWQPDSAHAALIGMFIALTALRITIAFAVPASTATVGDRVELRPATTSLNNLIIPARALSNPFARPGNFCTLDVNAMSNPGGALTVMAVRADGVLLSWAGGVTSTKADCRRANQPILISADDYEALLKTQFPKH